MLVGAGPYNLAGIIAHPGGTACMYCIHACLECGALQLGSAGLYHMRKLVLRMASLTSSLTSTCLTARMMLVNARGTRDSASCISHPGGCFLGLDCL